MIGRRRYCPAKYIPGGTLASQWKQIIPSHSIYDEWGMRERQLSTGFTHLRVGFSVDPLKGDDWARRKALEFGGFDAPKWRREQGIDYSAYRGQRIWPLMCKGLHAEVDVLAEEAPWTLFRVIDQGIRHPTVCLWVAVNKKGDRHVYREYYANNRSIAFNCTQILSLDAEENILGSLIDPSTNKRNEVTLKTLRQVYEENRIHTSCADNSFAGYDAVNTAIMSTLARTAIRTGVLPESLAALKPNQKALLSLADKPALTFDLRFTDRCFTECCNLRWQETKGDLTQKALREKPADKDDDGPDCIRYAVQSSLFYKTKPSLTIKLNPTMDIFVARRKLRERNQLQRRQIKRAYV